MSPTIEPESFLMISFDGATRTISPEKDGDDGLVHCSIGLGRMHSGALHALQEIKDIQKANILNKSILG